MAEVGRQGPIKGVASWLQAADHYVSLKTSRKESHDTGDYLLLVDNRQVGLKPFIHSIAHDQFFGDEPLTSFTVTEPADDREGFIAIDRDEHGNYRIREVDPEAQRHAKADAMMRGL